MKVWVLDMVGYDQRGGTARVFSTLEAAKAAVPHVLWTQDDDGGWLQQTEPGSMFDIWVIDEQEVL